MSSGNEKVPEPKLQQNKQTVLNRCSRNRNTKHKRSECAIARRKANRKARRAQHRRTFRQLKKYQPELATQVDTYPVAQECPSNNSSDSPINQNPPDILPSCPMKLEDIKIATLNLDGGIGHMSGREKIVHLMQSNNIDILALQETRINSDSYETHEGFGFYFSTSVSFENKKEADEIRKVQNARNVKTMSEIELYNLDAEKHGVALVFGKSMRACKLDVRQIDGRLLLATFETQPLNTNFIVAYAPHAGHYMQTKDSFYNTLNQLIDSLPRHEITIILGDFNARLMERLDHEENFVGPHIFRDEHSTIESLSEKQQDNRTTEKG